MNKSRNHMTIKGFIYDKSGGAFVNKGAPIVVFGVNSSRRNYELFDRL